MQGANSKESPILKVSAYGTELKREREQKLQDNLKKQELFDERLKKVMKENKDLKSKMEKKTEDPIDPVMAKSTLKRQEPKQGPPPNTNRLRNSSEEPNRGKVGYLNGKESLMTNEYSSDPETVPKNIKRKKSIDKEEFSFEKDFENLKNSQNSNGGSNYKEVFANGIILHNNHMAKRGVSETGSRHNENMATFSKKQPGTAETESKKHKTDISLFLPPLAKNSGLQINIDKPDLAKKNEQASIINKGSQSTKNEKGVQNEMRQSSHLLRHEMMNLNLKEKILQNDLVRFNAEKAERVKQLERKHQIRPNYTASKELFVQPAYEKQFNPPFDVLYEEDLEISLERIDFLIRQKQHKSKKEDKTNLASSHLVVFPKLQSNLNGASQEQERSKSKLINQKDIISQKSPKSTITQTKGAVKQEGDQVKSDQASKKKFDKAETNSNMNNDLEATFGKKLNKARDFSSFDEKGELIGMKKSEASSAGIFEQKQNETGRFNDKGGFEKNSSGFEKNMNNGYEKNSNGIDKGGTFLEKRDHSLEKKSDTYAPSISASPLMSVDKNRMSMVSEGGISNLSEGEQNMSYSELKKYREEMKRGIMIKHERLKNKINDVSTTKRSGKGLQSNEKKNMPIVKSQEKIKASGNQENMLHEIVEVDEETGGRISVHKGTDLRKVLIVEEDDDEELNEFL